MRVLIIDKTAVLLTSHERYEKLAAVEGIELAVLSPKRWTEHMRDVRAERVAHPNYRIYLESTWSRGSYSRGLYRRGLGEAIRDFKPDLVQLLEEPWSLFAWQTAKSLEKHRPGARLLFYTWENIFRKDTYCSWFDPLHRRTERIVFAKACAGICATRLASHVLLRKGFRKVAPVIPYGIDQAFFFPEKELQERARRPIGVPARIGYIGRLLPMKGVDTLLSAIPNLDVRLTLIGTGPEEPRLRRLAENLGVADRIDWISAVPPSEVPHHLRMLDLLVLPSRTTYTWAEQLGRVLLEAMASGVPVIGSTSGSIPEVIGKEGLVFAEGNPRDLASKIEETLSDSGARENRIVNAYQKVRGRYTWDRFVEDLAFLYRGIESGKVPS